MRYPILITKRFTYCKPQFNVYAFLPEIEKSKICKYCTIPMVGESSSSLSALILSIVERLKWPYSQYHNQWTMQLEFLPSWFYLSVEHIKEEHIKTAKSCTFIRENISEGLKFCQQTEFTIYSDLISPIKYTVITAAILVQLSLTYII